LTRYLNDPRLTPVTPEFCRETIEEVTKMQNDLRQRLGTTFAFLGDEIYLKAGSDIPARKHYGDYPQIEDGIGMVRSFTNQFESLMRRLERAGTSVNLRSAKPLSGTIMTGTLFAPVLTKLMGRINQSLGTKVSVLGVPNEYFGGDVSVAGLLTGGDFVAARHQVTGDFVIIPRVALKSDEPVMLDGMRFEELREKFAVPVYAYDFQGLASMIANPN
jgi:NifB/MoaA-like Fe-S oxidoreductase